MEITLSRFSEVRLAPSHLETLNVTLKRDYPALADDPLTLNLNCDLHPDFDRSELTDGQPLQDNQILCNWWIDYPDPTQTDGKRRLRVSGTRCMDIAPILSRYVAELACETHEFVRDKHTSGSEYRDGRGVCQHCGYQRPGVLAPDETSQLACCSMSSEKEYPTAHDWRDPTNAKVPLLQGGSNGLVFSQASGEARTTAFFEAFPTVGEHGTFIRGEGETLRDAEGKAWEAYQRYQACPGHEFSREVHGTHRTNGSGACTLCGLFSSTALPPETTCDCCGLPTNHKIGERVLCYSHFFEEVTFTDYLAAEMSARASLGNWARSVNRSDVAVASFIDVEIKKWALREFCEGDAARLEKGESAIEHLRRYIVRVYYRDHLSALRGDDKETGEEGEWPAFEEIIQPHLTEWLAKVKASGLLNKRIASAVTPNGNDEGGPLTHEDFAPFR